MLITLPNVEYYFKSRSTSVVCEREGDDPPGVSVESLVIQGRPRSLTGW